MNHRDCFWQVLALSGLLFAAVVFSPGAVAQGGLGIPEFAAGAVGAEFTFEGSVYSIDGAPAAGAVVVSSAGGKANVDENGRFRLSVRVPASAERVQVTAVGGVGGKLLASTQVVISVPSGSLSVPALYLSQTNSCPPIWLPTFGGEPGVSGAVYSLAMFDDGSGAALFVGGQFVTAGGIAANRIVKWDGLSWEPVGAGLSDRVSSMIVFDDGNGPALFVGGDFTVAGGSAANYVAKWDGTSWSALGGGRFDTVNALTVFDDGGGPALYAGGEDSSGPMNQRSLAKWDGTSWSVLDGGVEGIVYSMASFDDGSGSALYVGGDFTMAGGGAANYIAKWDGTAWSPLGLGRYSSVRSLAVYDSGAGPALVAGSKFQVGGSRVRAISMWNGVSWNSLGEGLEGTAHSLLVFDDGSGAELYAGGSFANGPASNVFDRVLKWDGSSWTVVLSDDSGQVLALETFDDGSGEALFVGGTFISVAGKAANSVAKRNGSKWEALGTGLNEGVAVLTVFDDGSGSGLYAGGDFVTAGGVVVNRIAKWDGSTWSPLGSGAAGPISALTVFDDGAGAALYAGGLFSEIGGVVTRNVAKWDGVSWSALGPGIGGGFSRVNALAVFDDGSGDALYVAGNFLGTNIPHILKWDGSGWSAVGAGLNERVKTLAVFDDGSGEALYVGGVFDLAGGQPANGIAKWNGSSWSPLGSGLQVFTSGGDAYSLAVFDDGSGADLIVAGNFNFAGGQSAHGIAKWDGSSWEPLSGELHSAFAMHVFDDGTGEQLYVGGEFLSAGGIAASGIARWDGFGWSAVGSGVNSGLFGVRGVLALDVYDDGGGEALFVGGEFRSVPDSGDSFLAEFGCPRELFNDSCNGDGGDQLGCVNCPCGNNASVGTIGGCLNSAMDSARLAASGDRSVSLPPGSADDLRFSLTGAPPLSLCILKSGDAVAPNNAVNPCFGTNSGVQSVFYDGLRCSVTNTRRHGGRGATAGGHVGLSNSPWGGEGGPPLGLAQAGGGFVSGQTRYFQVITRDDPRMVCGRGLNGSQAIEVVFRP